jgi:hypothetical protein
MLLHLPIVMLATLSPIAVSDQVPKFNVENECNLEDGGGASAARCSQDESAALGQLRTRWNQFGANNKKSCVGESSGHGGSSYVELLTCLEITRDVEKENHNAQGAGTGSAPPQPGKLGVTVGVGHGAVRSKATP